MNDEKKETILLLFVFAFAILWIGYVITHPTNYVELTPQRQIAQERIIFP